MTQHNTFFLSGVPSLIDDILFIVSVIADNTTVITPPSPQRVISCSQCGNSDMHHRIDRLSKQLDNLELSVSNDIKTILHILKHKNGEFLATEVSYC